MTTFQTIRKFTPVTLVGIVLVMVFAVSGFLAVQNGSSRLAAAAVVESANPPAVSSDTAPIDRARRADAAGDGARARQPMVENRMTHEAEEAAASVLGRGKASFYGRGFAGRPTASGETFNPAAMTAAHRTLPFGSKVRVTNTNNGRSIVVRVNDRGPFVHNRVIDLSQGAAERIGMIHSGTANVKIDLIS